MNTSENNGQLGEICIPQAQSRPVLQLVQDLPRALAVQEANVSLQDYRNFKLMSEGTEAWRIAGQNGAPIFEAGLELINLSNWDQFWVKNTVLQICQGLKLKRPARFLFQTSWTIVDDETGIVISDSKNPENLWESYAIPPPNVNIVRICLSPALKFPFVWDNKRADSGQSLQRVTWFDSQEEMFLYLAARELRFLWHWENLGKRQRILKLLELDCVEEAEIYALRTLGRNRITR